MLWLLAEAVARAQTGQMRPFSLELRTAIATTEPRNATRQKHGKTVFYPLKEHAWT